MVCGKVVDIYYKSEAKKLKQMIDKQECLEAE